MTFNDISRALPISFCAKDTDRFDVFYDPCSNDVFGIIPSTSPPPVQPWKMGEAYSQSVWDILSHWTKTWEPNPGDLINQRKWWNEAGYPYFYGLTISSPSPDDFSS